MIDADVITETDVIDPITIWVECELGENVCTGGGYIAEMKNDGHGWICWPCYYESVRQWMDMHELGFGR